MKMPILALSLVVVTLSSLTTFANSNDGAPAPAGMYGVGSGNFGDSSCMKLSPNGTPFGSPVPDSYCRAGYGVSDGLWGAACFSVDSSGRAYGSSVSDRYCQAGYAVGTDIWGASKCFKADAHGRTFGSAVSDSYCMR